MSNCSILEFIELANQEKQGHIDSGQDAGLKFALSLILHHFPSGIRLVNNP